MSRVSHVIDRIEVTFDDETLVADAGLIVPATLMVRLGLEALVNQTVRLVGRVGGARPGRKVLTLVAAILAGGSHIDHADKLRAGATGEVLPFRVMAPSTLGTFLRAFTFGHVRQLDAVIAETIRRAWSLGAGPGDRPVTIDLDSTICEVHGKAKHGCRLRLHRCSATTRCWPPGPTPVRCCTPGCARDPPSGATSASSKSSSPGSAAPAPPAPLTVRADAGFWTYALIDTLTRLGVGWSITVRINPRFARRSTRSTSRRGPPSPTPTAATPRSPRPSTSPAAAATGATLRLVVRRTRLTDPAQATAVARLAAPRLHHQRRTAHRRRRPVPPRPRHRRARHPRPQRRRRARALPVGPVLRQRRLAGLRRARPQPHPLDRPPR